MSSTSLESLQFLLQHMDANRRFEIYNRCPSLRELEKSVPLKMDRLVLNENYIVVNDTKYKLGIIRKQIVGETPRFIAANNKIGGVPYEVDRYGIIDALDAFTTTPGDVVMNVPGEPWIQNVDDQIGRIENQIQQNEVQLADLRERRPNRNLKTVNRLERIIEFDRAELFDYQSRRDNIPPIYEHFLQLTTSRDKQMQKTVQRYHHNKKYSEAMKQLTTVLFGGRSSPIHVTKFKFCCAFGVIRLPVGVKFHVDQLMFTGAVGLTLDALAPILEESSFPLKKLDIGLLSVDHVNNPIVKTSGILRIRVVLANILQTLSTITNPVVRVTTFLPDETLEELIANLIESQRPIGTEYTIYFCQEPNSVGDVEDMLERFNCVFVDEENVIIPMNDNAQLKVSYGPFPLFAPRSKYAVKLSTVAIEH